ncbi:helix-turn-helix domain-containing protein [Candidatus Uhrbacteria bacterium]|nr:helix-turn-helix domain-containing protein [Candidatus Uhrbacteria bacterium]
MVFVMRKLDRVPQTLGEKLRALRRGQAVTLGDIERETHVQRRYLEALERGRYEELPEPLYTRNFIRAYARALHADEKYFIELYEEECGRCDLLDPSRMPRQRVRKASLFNLPGAVAAGLLGLFALVVLAYFGWQFTGLVRAPEVVLYAPEDGMATDSALLAVRGEVVKGEATLAINGEAVIVNADNTFETTIDLERGLNVITVEAKRRYSRSAVIYRRVVFEPKISSVSIAD